MKFKIKILIYHLNHFKVCSSEALSTFALLCSYHHHPFPELFHLPKLKLYTT